MTFVVRHGGGGDGPRRSRLVRVVQRWPAKGLAPPRRGGTRRLRGRLVPLLLLRRQQHGIDLVPIGAAQPQMHAAVLLQQLRAHEIHACNGAVPAKASNDCQ